MRKLTPRQYAQAFIAAYEEAAETERAGVIHLFLSLIRKYHDSKKLPRIVQAVKTQEYERAGEIPVQVVSVRGVDADVKRSMAERLEKTLMKKVVLHESIDERVRGGIQMRIGDLLVDGTVKHSLEKLQGSFQQEKN